MKRRWLIELRKSQGLTVSEAAKKCSISRAFYAQIENGVRNPSVYTAQKIGQALGFDWTVFFPQVVCESHVKKEEKHGGHHTQAG